MALKKYIGARYAPKFMGAWDKSSQYAALSVVYTNEQSYVSRKTVPTDTEITNTEYWIKSADWNAQVTQYNRNVEEYNQNVEKYNQNVEAYQQAVSTFYADTLHSYDTKADMVADEDLQLGDTLLTCGDQSIGDTGGSFYQVVAETSAKAVALKNGLYALPFEFQPYDFSEFQKETESYKQDTDQKIQTFEEKVNQDVAKMKEVSLHTYNTQSLMKADKTLTANTVVMTAGEASIGDNKGSFYNVQETSDKTDAVPLDNGMKAVPFALNVGTIAGNALTFNGKSEVAGIWNVKAPATLTIPLTVPQGGTATTYLAVLYGSTSATVTANVTVNGTNQQLTFSDKADSGYDKFVIYAITVRNTDTIYWSKSTVSSWQTEYKTASIAYSTTIGTNPPAELQYITLGFTSDIAFTPTKDIILDSVTVQLPAGTYSNTALHHSGIIVQVYNKNTESKFDDLYHAYSVPTSGKYTFYTNNNTVLKANTTYALYVSAFNKTDNEYKIAKIESSAQTGTFDLLKLTRPSDVTWKNDFNGIISYHTAI